MNRSTYAIISLSTVLAAGVLLAVTFSKVPLTDPLATAAPTVAQGGLTTSASTIENQKSKIENPLPLEPTVHDPALIKDGAYYYLFATGNFINALRSKDLINWSNPSAAPATAVAAATAATAATRGTRGARGPIVRPASALPAIPNSVAAALPGTRELWAPDIAFYNGRFLLYYAASSFGSRNSAIGLATTKSLDPASRDFQWRDEGLVVRSAVSDDYNAIDPNFVLDERGQPWLAFGSFWSGIKLRKLTAEGKADPQSPTLYALAARTPPETAIEAPCIIREGRYFYLFVSWDKCCQGLRSTYRIMVGRSERHITGPYLDQNGIDMAKGGGTQVLAGDGKRYIGPGGQSLLKDQDRWLLVYHFYDGNTPQGTSRLQIRPVTFDRQLWPILGPAINSPN